jgi:hypothetical protein
MTSYVYMWFRPDGVPLYVGWGKHRVASKQPRWADHLKNCHNRYLGKMLREHGLNLPLVIVRDGLTPEEAKTVERTLIAAIGRADLKTGPLANHTDGGDGLTGANDEIRHKISQANRGRKNGPHSAETRAKISAANRGRKKPEGYSTALSAILKGRVRSPEFRAKVSAGMKLRIAEQGGPNNLGKKLSDQARANISKAQKGRKHSEAAKQNIRAAVKRRMADPKQRILISQRAREAWADPVIRERQIAAIRAAAPKLSESMKRVHAATRAKHELVYVRDEDMVIDPPKREVV